MPRSKYALVIMKFIRSKRRGQKQIAFMRERRVGFRGAQR